MWMRVIARSFARDPRRKSLGGAALGLAIAVTTATLGVALDVDDRMAREFRSLGANLMVTPQADTLPLEIGGLDYRPVQEGAYLSEQDVGRLKTIFWRLNVIGASPFLEVPIEARAAGGRVIASRTTLIGTWHEHEAAVPDGSRFVTGVGTTHPWWRIEGRWFHEDRDECVLGAELARRAGLHPGDRLTARAGDRTATLEITGVVATGGPEDDGIVAPLRVSQTLAGLPGRFRRLMVSALTKPEDAFARRDRATMTPAEYDRWYCTPYIASIASQIREVLPDTEVRVLRQVAEGEGRILTRIGRLMWAVTVAALAAAGLSIAATSASAVLERRTEIGLMKALGATGTLIAGFFLVEQLLLGIAGGAAGYGTGLFLGRILGRAVFGVPPTPRLLLLPAILALSAAVAILGSLPSLLRAARVRPAPILRGE
jgi:putative ABC transport system permease protein